MMPDPEEANPILEVLRTRKSKIASHTILAGCLMAGFLAFAGQNLFLFLGIGWGIGTGIGQTLWEARTIHNARKIRKREAH